MKKWFVLPVVLSFGLLGQDKPQAKCTGSNQVPQVVRKAHPEYTAEARKAGVTGAVLVAAEVGIDGRVRHIRIVKSLGYGLDQKAVECLRRWRFKPATRNGMCIPMVVPMEVVFHLPDSALKNVSKES